MPLEVIGEFLGTTILLLLGNGVVSNVVLNKTKGNSAGFLAITTGWAFAVLIAVIISGRVSGAHLNPAVTIAMLYRGDIAAGMAVAYIIAQILGGIVGGILVWAFYKDHFDETTDAPSILGCFCTAPAISNPIRNFFCECVATCVFVLAILGINHPNSGLSGIGAYLVSCSVWGIGLSLGGTTGYAINPARDLGPRIAHALMPMKHKGDSGWAYSWIPVLGPIVGALIAVLIFPIIA